MNKLNRTEIQKMMDAIKAFEKLQDEYRLDLRRLRDALQEGEL